MTNSLYIQLQLAVLGALALVLDRFEHFRRHVSRHVISVETGGAEMLELRILLPHGFLQIVQRLVNDFVHADLLGDLLDVPVAGDELRPCLHVDAVNAGKTERGRIRGEIDVLGPALPDHLDDGPRGVAPDDAVVDEQDVLVLELGGDRVELHPDRDLALARGGHDEGPADVAVFNQGFAVIQVELAGDFDGRVARRIGNGDDDVDMQASLFDLFGEELAEVDPAAVDVDPVDERVGPGEVDPFEQAGRVGTAGELFGVNGAVLVDEDRLAGGDIPDLVESHDVERDALRADGEGRDEPVAAHAPDERLDPEGVAERDQALLGDISHDRVTADDLAVNASDGFENMLRSQLFGLLVGQLLSEDVEDALDVVVRIEEAVVFLEEERLELGVIDDVAVVGHDDAEGRVDLERLGVLPPAAADRGVAGVADADVPPEPFGVLRGEDVADEAVALLGVEAAVVGDDAGRVLAAVLDGQEPLVEIGEDVTIAVEA